MKYVILGDEDNFNCIGIRTVCFMKKDVSEMNCKLEGGYVLNIFGSDLTDTFTEFLKSNNTVAVLMDSEDVGDSSTSYLELLDVNGDVVYKY